MTEKSIDTCTRCDGSGADPQRTERMGNETIPAACGTCAGIGEAPTAFGREIQAYLDWQQRYREERQALRSYSRR